MSNPAKEHNILTYLTRSRKTPMSYYENQIRELTRKVKELEDKVDKLQELVDQYEWVVGD